MIPKVIHYCWFGRGKMPELSIKCIDSWRKYMPDYEIKEWNEDNFDVNIIPYTSEAYKEKKYAFVSDYARFWILYNYGGVYFDTDVEVVRKFDEILERGPFMGCERTNLETGVITVAPGLGLSSYPHNLIYKEMLELYGNLSFYLSDGSMNLKTIVHYTTEVLEKYGLIPTLDIQEVCGNYIYPKDYFCPLFEGTPFTENTVSIHHYSGSWKSNKYKFKRKLIKFFPKFIVKGIVSIKALLRKL